MIGITQHQLLITLFASIDQDKNHYTQAPRKKLRELLVKWHHKPIGERWLSRCLKFLVDNGYITRQVRYRHDADGLITQRPSLWAFTRRGAQYLFANQVRKSARLLKTLTDWMDKKDNRWPSKEFIDRNNYRKLWFEYYPGVKRQPEI